jgi:ribosomal protein L29
MSQKFRVFKLRNQTEGDLSKGLDKLKEELSQLRSAKVSGGTAAKLGRIGVYFNKISPK